MGRHFQKNKTQVWVICTFRHRVKYKSCFNSEIFLKYSLNVITFASKKKTEWICVFICLEGSWSCQLFPYIFYLTLTDYRRKYVLTSSSLLNASQAVRFLKTTLNSKYFRPVEAFFFVQNDGGVMCSPGRWKLITHQWKHFVSKANAGRLSPSMFDLLSWQHRAGEDK